MPIDRIGDPWTGATYKGFSGGPGAGRDPPPRPGAPARRRPSTPVLMAGGVAAALALGVLFGLWARPELIGSKPPPAVAPTVPAIASPPGAAQIPVTVNSPKPPEPLPRAPGKLETLSPQMAAAAQARVAPRAAAPAADPSDAAAAASPPEAAEAPPAPRFRASFDCATARPGAEELVCGHPSLAAADRQMARAYRRAMRSGVDPDDLRQEQRDWVAIREDAAMRSRQALAEVYDQRIQDLNRIAESAPQAAD